MCVYACVHACMHACMHACVHAPTTKIKKAMYNVEIWVVCGVRGHPRSPAMSAFDRVHNLPIRL